MLEEQRLSALSEAVEQSPASIIITDISGTILYVNKKFTEISGYSPDEVLGRNPRILQSGIHSRDYYREIWDTILSGREWRGELQNKKKNGKPYWEIALISPVFDQDGKIHHLLAVKEDITARKRKEEELNYIYTELKQSHEVIAENLVQKNFLIKELTETKERLEKTNSEKDKFFSIIGHDLKNPFNALINLSSLLSSDYNELTEEEKMGMIKGIETISRRTYNLLESLLTWSRSQTGQIEFKPEVINLNKIIGHVTDLYSDIAGQKSITVNICTPDDIMVCADLNMLETVLRNLLSNAVKFTQPKGIITISAEPDGRFMRFKVSDTGIGLTQTDIVKLFRLDILNSEIGNSPEKGTGLGLLLCREFVERHGGSIHAESEKGKGSTFIFTIPAVI
ncbi:MAG: PAS domain S-box protein [Syntrophothermus sp.]